MGRQGIQVLSWMAAALQRPAAGRRPPPTPPSGGAPILGPSARATGLPSPHLVSPALSAACQGLEWAPGRLQFELQPALLALPSPSGASCRSLTAPWTRLGRWRL